MIGSHSWQCDNLLVTAGSLKTCPGHAVVCSFYGLYHKLTIYGSVVAARQFDDLLVKP